MMMDFYVEAAATFMKSHSGQRKLGFSAISDLSAFQVVKTVKIESRRNWIFQWVLAGFEIESVALMRDGKKKKIGGVVVLHMVAAMDIGDLGGANWVVLTWFSHCKQLLLQQKVPSHKEFTSRNRPRILIQLSCQGRTPDPEEKKD
ncbi:hypothetical protein V8G54_024108 [Vigna mungo]|uniref:Uncharacterized protein n=1 Tax=Vigna mungo TaxID=3915 RepID=A0AAQ3RR03_VIGMU